jgi:MraZ protein
LSVGHADVRNLRRLLFSGAADVETDRQGRILIPPNLREYAGLSEQVVVVGNDTYFEIWSRERWQFVLETLDNNGSQLAQQLASLGL